MKHTNFIFLSNICYNYKENLLKTPVLYTNKSLDQKNTIHERKYLNINKTLSILKVFKKATRKIKVSSWVALLGPSGGFLGVGTSEVIVIGAVAWLVLGPKRLYQLAKDIGKISGEIKSVAEEAKQSFQQAVEVEPKKNENIDSPDKLTKNKEKNELFVENKKKLSLDDNVLNEISELDSN